MTPDRPARRGVSPRDRREDLLSDLRATVPVPAVPGPATDPAGEPAAHPAAHPAPPAHPGTPAVEVRLTPLRWSPVGAAPVPDRTGVLLSLGPVQVFLGLHAD